MSLSLIRQTWGICLLSLAFGLVPFASQSAPFLRNANIPPANENEFALLTADIGSGGGGNMILRVNWGDGTPLDVYSVTNTATNFAVGHVYRDDNPTNTPADLYTVSITLSNNTGGVATNLGVAVRNVPPSLGLTVNSPIEIGAPATQRGLNIREFVVPTPDSDPTSITVGPDGNLWFSETGANRIGRITTNGVITEFPLSGGPRPAGIAAGPDGRLWFCASGSQQIGAMTTNGVATLYTIPRGANEPFKTPQMIVRRGNAMWYTDLSYRIGRITTSGVVVTQYVHEAGVNPLGLTVGADNNIWFAAYFTDTIYRLRVSDGVSTAYFLTNLASPALMIRGPDDNVWFTQVGAGTNAVGRIGRVTTNGVVTNFVVGFTGPYGICAGPDDNIWFTERRFSSGVNAIGRMTVDGKLVCRYGLAIHSDVSEIVTGPDGGLWFTMPGRDRIGRIRFTTSGNVLLSGELNDPGDLDTHTVQIDWGDGSPVETVNLAAGIASFHVTHTYSGSEPLYLINVTASDDDTGVDQASTVVVVNSVRLRSIIRAQNGDVQITGTGANGQTITIEGSSNLQNWSTVGTVNSVSNTFEFIHSNPPGAIRFYRGRVP